MTAILYKYDAAGNDFLLSVDWERADRFDAPFAARVSDRHHGVGADGLIRISESRSGASFRMELLNADGSSAETSGNGLRCAVLCALDEGIVRPGVLLVETDAGDVGATIGGEADSSWTAVRVEMGMARAAKLDKSPVPGTRAYSGDIGNPHLVLIGEKTADVDLAVVGRGLVDAVAGGQNVMVIAPTSEPDELDLVAYERGCGFTLACGSGSAVAALAAHIDGLVGEKVVVHNPGGDLFVEITRTDEAFAVALSGPVRRVATVTIDDDEILSWERAAS
ncbi:MAG: diaminopimelate epimerase [Acidimicrobiales bacterium]